MALLAWGGMAFGAVYPWGYLPLAAASITAGVLGFVHGPRNWQSNRALHGLLLLVAAAIGLQLIPLPVEMLGAISPRTVETLNVLDPQFAAGLQPQHAISIHPRGTATALGLFVSFVALLVGASALFSTYDADRTVRALIGLGALMAVVGIVQAPLYDGKIYGFWRPYQGGNPFGGFVNKNHFAGWMLMALPLAFGYFCMGLARSMRGVRSGLRDRMLWFSSPDANRLLLTVGAALVMALALMMTLSRSAIGALAAAVLLTGWMFLRSANSAVKKVIAIAYLLSVLVLAFVWAGTDIVTSEFARADWKEINARSGAWADAGRLFELFPVAGTGINTYGTSMLVHQAHTRSHHFYAAHNDYLQVLAEGGLLVAIPVGLAILIFGWTVRRRLHQDAGSSHFWLRAGAVTAIVAIGLQEIVEFSLQMPGNTAMFAVVCAIACHPRHRTEALAANVVAPVRAKDRWRGRE